VAKENNENVAKYEITLLYFVINREEAKKSYYQTLQLYLRHHVVWRAELFVCCHFPLLQAPLQFVWIDGASVQCQFLKMWFHLFILTL
jgi:hypothetical protein